MRIIHVLADGRELESLEGFVVEQEKNAELYEAIIKEIEKEKKELKAV